MSTHISLPDKKNVLPVGEAFNKYSKAEMEKRKAILKVLMTSGVFLSKAREQEYVTGSFALTY